MLSRALSLATVTLLIGFAAVPARAQNLEAGKSASQIFAGGCAVCHKSPRGLLKTVAPGSLPGFLRQHYTTSPEMASSLSAYVISNGASDTRTGGGGLTKQGRELSTEQRPAPGAAPGAPPAAAAPAEDGGLFGFLRRKREPAVEAAPPAAEPTARERRNAKRQARPAVENPDAAKPAVEGQPPVAAEGEPVAPRQQKQKLSKKRRDREEAPKTDAVKDEPSTEPKSEPARAAPVKPEPKHETAKPEPARDEPKPEAARPEPAPKAETAPVRADPVPPVTPAPRASEPESRPAPVEAPAPEPAKPTAPASE